MQGGHAGSDRGRTSISSSSGCRSYDACAMKCLNSTDEPVTPPVELSRIGTARHHGALSASRAGRLEQPDLPVGAHDAVQRDGIRPAVRARLGLPGGNPPADADEAHARSTGSWSTAPWRPTICSSAPPRAARPSRSRFTRRRTPTYEPFFRDAQADISEPWRAAPLGQDPVSAVLPSCARSIRIGTGSGSCAASTIRRACS